MHNDLFTRLQINTKIHSGACAGLEWLPLSHEKVIDSINPANERLLGRVDACTKTQYETILIAKALHAQLQWRQMPAPKRGEIIRQIGMALREYKALLGELVALETGKLIQEGLGEIQEMIDMADFAVGQSRMLYGLSMHSERPQHRMYEQWHPLGVIGVITAFNFPVAVWAWNAFVAAIAGNTVIWKPSSKTPLCAIAVQRICNQVMQANQLDGIFSLAIFSDKTLADTFVDDNRIPLISFTGSTSTGCRVGERVAKRLGRSLLELGGNNAIIIDETADLELALRAVVFSAIGTAGQRCTSLRRLFIHDSLHDAFIEKLQQAYQQIRLGDPLNTQTLMGPLIDKQAVQHYQAALDQIQRLGGSIITGGKVLNQAGFYVEPTIVSAQNEWAIVQQETFAPILYVMRYQDFRQAVAMQNHAKHGLSSALFSQSHKHIEYFLSHLGSDCGIANINIGTSGAEIGGAFGGEKETGGGREAGSDAWKTYMRRQTCTINWGDDLPLAQGIDFKLDSASR